MQKYRKYLLMLGALVVIGGLAWLAYYIYESVNFFYTDNAQVTADMITIYPVVTGKLTSWNVNVGDFVKAGQVLGVQDVSTQVTSTATNPDTLANTAGSVVEHAEITSPIDGQVVQNNFIQGQIVAPGTGMAIVADTAHFYIRANIEETSILRIRKGQAVDVHIDAYPHRSFEGYVESIEPATQTAFSPLPNLNTSGTYSKVTQLIPVKIEIPDAVNLRLMLGMNAEVKIHVK
jgi:multidrug resistance efflux pump